MTESMAQKDLKYSEQLFIDTVLQTQLVSISSVLSLHGHTVASSNNEHFLSRLLACLSGMLLLPVLLLLPGFGGSPG